MTDWNEQLAYFLILAQLLNEADLQLEADAEAPASLVYAEDLEDLRTALGSALDAAAAIIERVQAQRTSSGHVPKISEASLRVTH